MKCPKDGTPLETARYEADVHVDRCPACRGTWLEAGELERIQRSRERDHAELLARMPDYGYDAIALAAAKADQARGCPKCGALLERREYGYCSQVSIDVCARCAGIWLDHREVEALEVFFERARADAADLRQSFLASLRDLVGPHRGAG
jgi:Zn-finger nucleic acid-binding protein